MARLNAELLINPPMDSPSTAAHPDCADSSPRSRPDAGDDNNHLLPPIPGSKLRLMCSYGGHIIPRPHDKSLCYVGGDTRIVVVDRHSPLAQLRSRLSLTLLNGRHFTLKYQLPSEDLDSLVSLATDEDLENMIEEYDRTSPAFPLKPSRLRLFLFPSKPETAASMGSLLDDAKSESWFVDALNGAGLLPRGLSDSAADVDTLLEIDGGMVNRPDSCPDLERAQNESKQAVSEIGSIAQEVTLDSPPLVETSSSSGSRSSTPSMVNLPPIKVRLVDHQMPGLDDHVSIDPNLVANAAPPVAATKSGGAGPVHGENTSRVVSDDGQKSDHGIVAPTGLRKPPLPLQPVQRKLADVHNLPSPDSKHGGGYNLPSPDSVTSDCSVASAGSLSKSTVYQDETAQAGNVENRTPSPVMDQKAINARERTSSHQASMQKMVDSVSNQHFIHPGQGTHYIRHPVVPVSSYYPLYLHLPTQQSNQQQTDPQYPMYFRPPLTQTQPCYDPPLIPSRPLTPPPNNLVPYKEPFQPVYAAKPEANLYPAASGTGGATPMLVQVPAAPQFQPQYVGVSQTPPPAQPNDDSAAPSYGYEYSHHLQDQVYYGQHVAASAPPPQYQTMTPAAAVMLSQASTQLPPPDPTAQQS